MHGIQIDKVEYKEMAKDLKQVTLQVNVLDGLLVTEKVEGNVVLKFGMAYGFRHIGTILRSIKQKNCDFDFVEVNTPNTPNTPNALMFV